MLVGGLAGAVVGGRSTYGYLAAAMLLGGWGSWVVRNRRARRRGRPEHKLGAFTPWLVLATMVLILGALQRSPEPCENSYLSYDECMQQRHNGWRNWLERIG